MTDRAHFWWKLLASSLIELGPVLVFYVAYQITDLLTAIFLVVIITSLSMLSGYLYQRRFALFPLLSGGFAVLFGVFSLFFRDPIYYIIEHTLFYWGFAVMLFIGLMKGKSYLKPMFDEIFAITDKAWMISAQRYTWVYAFLGLGNELAWRFGGQDVWVHYKFFTPWVIVVLSFFQLQLCRQERLPGATKWGFRK
jgi:intracellular septation protein